MNIIGADSLSPQENFPVIPSYLHVGPKVGTAFAHSLVCAFA